MKAFEACAVVVGDGLETARGQCGLTFLAFHGTVGGDGQWRRGRSLKATVNHDTTHGADVELGLGAVIAAQRPVHERRIVGRLALVVGGLNAEVIKRDCLAADGGEGRPDGRRIAGRRAGALTATGTLCGGVRGREPKCDKGQRGQGRMAGGRTGDDMTTP